ncbi:MAG: hypothetical protein GQ474_07995 [Sulfurimonas sp.]|nr:hypothetical protein [Sulfurimonas sp.]
MNMTPTKAKELMDADVVHSVDFEKLDSELMEMMQGSIPVEADTPRFPSTELINARGQLSAARNLIKKYVTDDFKEITKAYIEQSKSKVRRLSDDEIKTAWRESCDKGGTDDYIYFTTFATAIMDACNIPTEEG